MFDLTLFIPWLVLSICYQSDERCSESDYLRVSVPSTPVYICMRCKEIDSPSMQLSSVALHGLALQFVPTLGSHIRGWCVLCFRCPYPPSSARARLHQQLRTQPVEVVLRAAPSRLTQSGLPRSSLTSRTLKRKPRNASRRLLLPSLCPPMATISGMGNVSPYAATRRVGHPSASHATGLCRAICHVGVPVAVACSLVYAA